MIEQFVKKTVGVCETCVGGKHHRSMFETSEKHTEIEIGISHALRCVWQDVREVSRRSRILLLGHYCTNIAFYIKFLGQWTVNSCA